MKYTFNDKTINIPDKDIERLMNTLNISQEDAIETWLSDEGYLEDETVLELSDKAKKNRITATIHQAKATDLNKKERKPRERKKNPLKQSIIRTIFYALQNEYNENDIKIAITNDEKYVDFTINELNFTVNLVQHREKKEK